MSERNEVESVETVEAETVEVGRRPGRRCQGERGLATVEYAVGILLILTVVGVMVWSAQQGWFKELVEALFRTIFQLVTQHLVV